MRQLVSKRYLETTHRLARHLGYTVAYIGYAVEDCEEDMRVEAIDRLQRLIDMAKAMQKLIKAGPALPDEKIEELAESVLREKRRKE